MKIALIVDLPENEYGEHYHAEDISLIRYILDDDLKQLWVELKDGGSFYTNDCEFRNYDDFNYYQDGSVEYIPDGEDLETQVDVFKCVFGEKV